MGYNGLSDQTTSRMAGKGEQLETLFCIKDICKNNKQKIWFNKYEESTLDSVNCLIVLSCFVTTNTFL